MNPKKQENGALQNKNINNKATDIGLDPEEQAMNGMYGMVETEYEDSLPHSTTHEGDQHSR